jgi:hypothetical protein
MHLIGELFRLRQDDASLLGAPTRRPGPDHGRADYVGTRPLNFGMTSRASSSIECRHAAGLSA